MSGYVGFLISIGTSFATKEDQDNLILAQRELLIVVITFAQSQSDIHK